ncbi:hypothetical protein PSTG_11764 [Puccinia striiformis f. sp. tritici PST-78]|uniref:Tet-like 2OG-Fe(II) oxygenase domain-containing protein n=1 Tax=Puccinia striiformis f. sp. tritici PST-78 TaxID=1165861 RepID=A0A0L0V784_9BASI|nr:hypothetical protein PSTG_11764 [Puccinia striiformis f. sp. tritici PST-78]
MARPTSFCSSTGFDYHSTTVRLRLAYRRRQGIVMKPHSIDKKFRELDLFPEITKEIAKELAREEEERSKRVQDYEEHLRKYPDMQTFPKPTNRPIIPRLPTTDEYDDALRHVADNFRIIDHGRTIAFDAKEDRIIYSAQYYKISHLEREHRENLDSLCDFLHRCKQFISFLATRDQDAIEANQGEYTNLMEGSEKAGKAIWSNFRLLTAKAADETKEYFQNLSKIALKSEGHQVENGQFVLPDYKIAFSFPSYFICGIIFRPQASAHGTMQATEVGDSTRLGVCIQPVPKLSYDIKKVQPAPLNETSSTSGN